MSHPDDGPSKTYKPFAVSDPKIGSFPPMDTVSDRFRSGVSVADKPDSNGFDSDSPVTTLMSNNTSSSSSSSGSVAGRNSSSSGVNRSHSGELPRSTGTSPSGPRVSRPGHVRSCSGPLIYSGSSGSSGGGGGSASSAPVLPPNLLPAGNICPSGKIGKTGMATRSAARSDVLGLGTGNYGHGSIVRGVGSVGTMSPLVSNVDGRRTMGSMDPEEVKRAGNELYRKGQYAEALKLYDRAIAILPSNVIFRSNKAAALMGMGRLDEALRECEEAVRLDPMNGKVHHRLASLHLRLGQVDSARRHLHFTGELPDPIELQKLQSIERHLSKCADARRIEDWKSVLQESDEAIVAGADSSSQLAASRAEALLRLNRVEDADSTLMNTVRLEASSPSCLQTKLFGMLSNSYLYVVRAQVEMALGRFEKAEVAADKAQKMDPQNKEVARVWNNVKSVVRARARGSELFSSGMFSEACLAYGEGLKFDPSNPVLYCNRAVCYSKLGQWDKSIGDCNEALKIQPNYTKALLRRAASYEKLERWVEAVRDYEVLRKELPANKEIAENLFHAQVALKAARGEEISNMKFGGEVEKIMGIEQFHAAISLPGISVVYFMAATNQNSLKISPFVDVLCTRYPSVNFLKVNTDECPAIAKAENVKIVPTFKIYKNGMKVKEMICPSQQVLEYSVRHYEVQQ